MGWRGRWATRACQPDAFVAAIVPRLSGTGAEGQSPAPSAPASPPPGPTSAAEPARAAAKVAPPGMAPDAGSDRAKRDAVTRRQRDVQRAERERTSDHRTPWAQPPTGFPQFPQNFAPGPRSEPHSVHFLATGASG